MALAIVQSLAFAPSTSRAIGANLKYSPISARTSLNMIDMSQIDSSMPISVLSNSNTVSAATVDPTTALSQVLGGLLGTPAILLVPILAAVSVATIIAWLIVSYANPADPDDEWTEFSVYGVQYISYFPSTSVDEVHREDVYLGYLCLENGLTFRK